ncbi:MAG: metal ABC transporter substrate-binding protein [Peptococcia bacterium]|jgi:zinc transport system substrate-binding protein
MRSNYIVNKNRTVKKILSLILIFSLGGSLLAASGCARHEQNPSPSSLAQSPRPTVYTSIYPLYDLTRKIGGDKVTVINLTPAGSEPHSFEPSSRTVADLSKASLFLYHGAGMEPYLNKLLHTLQGTPLLMLEASRGISLLTHPQGEEDPHKEHSHEEVSPEEEPAEEASHEIGPHGQTDPHTWLSPVCALQLSRNILQALIQIVPDQEAFFEENYRQLEKRLTELDQEYRETLSACQRKEIVVTHEAFGYLCREYGLTQLGIMGLSAEAEPTPGTVKEIINLVRDRHIKYIFFETLYSPKIAETIARETNTEILVLNPFGSLTEKEIAEGEDYFTIMKENLENLKKALEWTNE